MPPTPDRTWSQYPKLHDAVSQLLQQDNFSFTIYGAGKKQHLQNEYDTNVMGRFVCKTKTYNNNAWTSKRIAIAIRMFTGNRYNATVYHQRCKKCNSLSRPFLDEDVYTERVSYRIKKWCGVEMERPFFSGGQSKGPHERALCEGCRAGHCTQGFD